MKKLIALSVMLGPATSVWAQSQQINNTNDVIARLIGIGNSIISILIAFAVLYIIYNVVQFIIKADDPEERKVKGSAIMWGIIGLAIILSIWGLVNIIRNSFNVNNNAPTAPTINARPITDPALINR